MLLSKMHDPKRSGITSPISAKWNFSIRPSLILKYYPIMATMRIGNIPSNTPRNCRTGRTRPMLAQEVSTSGKLSGTWSSFIWWNRLIKRVSMDFTVVSGDVKAEIIWLLRSSVHDFAILSKLNDFFFWKEISAFIFFVSCFFSVKSMGEFQITDLNEKDSLCVETVKYQCPMFMASFCRKEVEYQRKKIVTNLQLHFSKQKI